MRAEEKISIIVPVYNAEKYLKDTLGDLIEQTYQNIEIIVIDDGSTDGSKEIIRDFQKKDKRIIAKYTKNGGPSKARNLGLDIATGKYIRFIDSDDRIPRDSTRWMLIPYLKLNDIDLVIGNYKCVSKKEYFAENLFCNEKVGQEEFADRFVNNVHSFYFGVPWNKLYKREIIEKNHIRFLEDVIWSEDFIFNVSYYEKCSNMFFVYTSRGVYDYYDRIDSITNSLGLLQNDYFDRINRIRFEKGKSYFEQYNKDSVFLLEWKYSNLYAKLSVIAKNKEYGSFKIRYKKFKEFLINQEVYSYICEKRRNSNLVIWRLLQKAIETKHYRIVFLLFVYKGYIARLIKAIKVLLNSIKI